MEEMMNTEPIPGSEGVANSSLTQAAAELFEAAIDNRFRAPLLLEARDGDGDYILAMVFSLDGEGKLHPVSDHTPPLEGQLARFPITARLTDSDGKRVEVSIEAPAASRFS